MKYRRKVSHKIIDIYWISMRPRSWRILRVRGNFTAKDVKRIARKVAHRWSNSDRQIIRHVDERWTLPTRWWKVNWASVDEVRASPKKRFLLANRMAKLFEVVGSGWNGVSRTKSGKMVLESREFVNKTDQRNCPFNYTIQFYQIPNFTFQYIKSKLLDSHLLLNFSQFYQQQLNYRSTRCFPKKNRVKNHKTPKLPPSPHPKRTIDEPPSPFEKNRHLLPATLPTFQPPSPTLHEQSSSPCPATKRAYACELINHRLGGEKDGREGRAKMAVATRRIAETVAADSLHPRLADSPLALAGVVVGLLVARFLLLARSVAILRRAFETSPPSFPAQARVPSSGSNPLLPPVSCRGGW